MLRGMPVSPEIRSADEHGEVRVSKDASVSALFPGDGAADTHEDEDWLGMPASADRIRILPFGVSKSRLAQTVHSGRMPIEVVDRLERAEILLTTKQFFRKMPRTLKSAEEAGKSIFVLRKNTPPQIREFLVGLSQERGWEDPVTQAVREAEEAALQVQGGGETVALTPQMAYIRRIQHRIAQESSLVSTSVGREPHRRVTISRR